MRVFWVLVVALLSAAISLTAVPKATAANCQPNVAIDVDVLPPELSDPPVPHAGDPKIRTVCIRSQAKSGPAAAESPVEFWCTLAVWPPAIEVGGLFMDAAAGVLCNGPILGMQMTEALYQLAGQTQTPFGSAATLWAVGPVIWVPIAAPCALFPWQRQARVMINTAYVAVYAIDPASDGSLFDGTFGQPQTLIC